MCERSPTGVDSGQQRADLGGGTDELPGTGLPHPPVLGDLDRDDLCGRPAGQANDAIGGRLLDGRPWHEGGHLFRRTARSANQQTVLAGPDDGGRPEVQWGQFDRVRVDPTDPWHGSGQVHHALDDGIHLMGDGTWRAAEGSHG